MENLNELVSEILIDSTVKSVFMFLVVLAVLAAIRMRRTIQAQAHAVHRVWVFLVVSMLLLPILSVVLPSLLIPLPVSALESQLAVPADRTVIAQTVPSFDSANEIDKVEGSLNGPHIEQSANLIPVDSFNEDFPAARERSDTTVGNNVFASESVQQAEATTVFAIPLQNLVLTIWSIVSIALLGQLIVAKIKTVWLIKNSKPIVLPKVSGQAIAIESSRISSPVVHGLFKHTIIFPTQWRQWSTEKRAAVVEHELAHVRRRDGLVLLLADVNTAIFWFNPISWIARCKISRLAEFACDQTAVMATGDRLGYAQQLLEIAAERNEHEFQPGIAMAAAHGISGRIEMLLDTNLPFTRSTSRFFIASMLVVGAPLLMVVAAAQPSSIDEQTMREKAGTDWIRTEDGKTFLTFRGEVVDEDGNAISNPIVRAVSRAESSIETSGHEFEIELELENWHMAGLAIIASSENEKLAGSLLVYSHDYRMAASQFHRIVLKPTRAFEFTVTDEGLPAVGVNVRVKAEDKFTSEGVTGEDGIATLNFPATSELDEVLAWGGGKIGGYSFDREPVRDPNLAAHKIALSACVDQKIRLVDSKTGNPLAGVKFESHVATKKPNYNFLPRREMQILTTDENGEVIDPWFPDWEGVHFYARLDRQVEYGQGWSKSGDGKSKIVDGVFVQEFEQSAELKRLPFHGRVVLPQAVKGGLEVRLTSYQHPEEGRYDPLTARTDIDGNFTADVLPGATYSIAVNDSQWASEPWVGILAGPGSEEVAKPEIKIFKGERIKITVTVGPDKRPMANEVISFSSEYSFEWKEDGESRSGSDSLQWWAVTNEKGIATTTAAPGDFESHIYNPDWRPSQNFKVIKGESTEITFHRPSPGKRLLKGKLSMPKGKVIDLTGAIVELRAVDGETKANETVKTDNDGNFSVEMDGARIGGFAKTADGKQTATFFSGDPESGLKATLCPVILYRGKFIDGNDQPLKNKQVKLRVILKEKEPDWSKTNFVSSQFDVDSQVTQTDEEGEFEFEVPANMPLRLSVQLRTPSESDDGFKSAGEKFLDADEERPLEVMRIGRKSRRALSIEETIEWKVRDCRLSNTRMLVVLEGEGDSVSEFLKTALNEDEKENRGLYWYTVTRFSQFELGDEKCNAFWTAFQSLPGKDEAVFLVLGPDGKLVDSVLLDTDDPESITKAAKFVDATKVETVDAKKTLADALVAAKASDRKVWLQFSQTRCGPCFLMSRWIDRQKELFKKDYVVIKVDDVRDEHGSEIWKQYVGDRSMGIPFTVILDADGELLEESTDRLKSNVGHPSTFEDKKVIRRMVEKTSKHLSAEEIESLVGSIGEN